MIKDITCYNQQVICKECDSFEQWCLDHKRQDVLDRWDYELNKCSPNQIFNSANSKYYFKCTRGIHKSELKSINGFTNGDQHNIMCKECNSFAQWGIDNICSDFLEKYWDYEKNINVDPWKIFHCSKTSVYIICQNHGYHGSYEIKCNDFLSGNRCPFCTNKNGKVHKLDSLGYLYPQMLDIWSDKNNKSPYEYSPMSNQKVWWKCSEGKHKDYYRSIINSNNKCDFRCPECVRERDESFIQEKVRKYLENIYPQYQLNHEYNCTLIPQNPKIKDKRGQLPFDNEIIVKNLHLIIEVHGEQHYALGGYHKLQAKHNNTTPEYEFHKQKLHDRYKKYVAFRNGYFYLAIPHWVDDEEESYKKLVDDTILKLERGKYL